MVRANVAQSCVVSENKFYAVLSVGRRQLLGLILLTALFGSCATVDAQVTPPGTPPFSSAGGGQYDTINLSNLFITILVPVRNKAGAIPFNYVYSQYSYVNPQCNPAGRIGCAARWAVGSSYGFHEQHSVSAKALSVQQSACPVGGGSKTTDSNWVVIDASGTQHPVSGAAFSYSSNPVCGVGWSAGTTSDGSAYTLSFPNNSGTQAPFTTIVDQSGGTASIGYTDPNGNQITYGAGANGSETYTDTLGQPVATETYDFSGTPTTYSASYTYPSGSNNSVSFKVSLPTFTAATAFGCSYPNDIELLPTSVTLPSSVALPDGSTLGFTYEPTSTGSANVTGRLAKLTLPTGGTITYSYSGGTNGINCFDGSPAILQRTDSGGTWKYMHTAPTSTSQLSYTNVTDPAGNVTYYTFSNNYETQRLVYQKVNGTLTLVKTITTCYNGTFANCASATVAGPFTRTDTYQTVGSQTSLSERFYNSAGLPTQDNEYDYGINTGAAPTGSPIEATKTTYASLGSIYDRPSCIQVTVGASPSTCGTVTASTKSITNYLNYSPQGNVGTIQQWVGGSKYLSRSITYNSNGTVNTSTDVNGTVTTFAYNGSGGCNGVLPTSQTVGGLTTSKQWDCNGGVVTQSSDENGQPTILGYDMFWRNTSATDPSGSVANTKYTPATGSAAATVETYMNFPLASPTSTVDTLYTLDGLGRLLQSSKRTAPGASTFDHTVQSGYGWTTSGSMVGPFATQTVPDGTAVATTQMDVLGRKANFVDSLGGTVTASYLQNDVLQTLGPAPAGEHTKSRQLQYDALGRATSVCEILASGGSSCGQNAVASGYRTSYAYGTAAAGGSKLVVTQGVQTRTYVYDGLGRLVSETNPESGATTYTYDSYPPGTCGGWTTEPGDLMLKTNNDGSAVCYVHDTFHRLTDTGTSATTGNVCRRFRYDTVSNALQAQPAGFTASTAHLAGRLVEAETDSCTAFPPTKSSMITDEWFAYDANGRMTDMWEYTPRAQLYYHTSASYYPNGLPNTLAGLPGYSTITYGVDSEGRWNTASVGTTAVVSGVTYGPVGPTTVSIGAGTDRDSYTYDSMGRMSQYQFFVGTASNKGVLNWNPNGTLGSVVITDGFNSSDTQSCIFGYDDLARLTGDNCGSVWSQTYSYDQYGNLSKSGSASFGCAGCYNPANNQFQTIGATYDANGNVTYDGSANHYTWDVYQKMVTVNASTVTYDAFGRAVAGGSGEILYTPLGKVGVLQNSTRFYSASVPMPGGGAMSLGCCSSNNIWYLHRDWIRTSRVISGVPTSGNGSVYNDRSFSPYGDEYQNSGYNDPLLFAGMNSDLFATSGTGSALYDTANRELAINASRWLSPDPSGIAAVDVTNPQSWNRYGYVNDPLISVDQAGLFCLPWLPHGCNWLNPLDGAIGSCMMDDVDTPCNLVYDAVKYGAGVQCPANDCRPTWIGGVAVMFKAYMTGSTYDPFAGPGSIFDTNDQALAAGAMYAENQSLLNNGNEQCGVTTPVDDQYTYSAPKEGSSTGCEPKNAMTSDFEQVSGFYHSHGRYDPANRMSEISDFPPGHDSDQSDSNFWGIPTSLATPGGVILIYYPGPGCQTFLQGGPTKGSTIPTCH